jgi:5-formyltetrahydrofolate cyclo-ligase
MDKEQLRQKYHKILRSMTEEEQAVRSKKICENLVATDQFIEADTIMSFLSIPHEVDTSDIILSAWQRRKTVAAPKVSWQQRHMLPVEINTLEKGFSMEAVGIRNPVSGVPIPFENIDLVITPGLVFGKTGNRLGRGGSYYDRFFNQKGLNAVKCAVAFEEQLIDDVPVTETDVAMDMLVTQNQVYYFNS